MELLTWLFLSEAISSGLVWTPALGLIPYDVFITDVAGDNKYLLVNTCCEKDDWKCLLFQFSSRKFSYGLIKVQRRQRNKTNVSTGDIQKREYVCKGVILSLDTTLGGLLTKYHIQLS